MDITLRLYLQLNAQSAGKRNDFCAVILIEMSKIDLRIYNAKAVRRVQSVRHRHQSNQQLANVARSPPTPNIQVKYIVVAELQSNPKVRQGTSAL